MLIEYKMYLVHCTIQNIWIQICLTFCGSEFTFTMPHFLTDYIVIDFESFDLDFGWSAHWIRETSTTNLHLITMLNDPIVGFSYMLQINVIVFFCVLNAGSGIQRSLFSHCQENCLVFSCILCRFCFRILESGFQTKRVPNEAY